MQRTPLHYAAMKGHSETVQYLVKQGANVHVKDTASEVWLSYSNDENDSSNNTGYVPS